MDVLVVVDMQNDFIDGALGTKEAVAIVPKVAEKIRNFDGKVLFTRDIHRKNYLETQEGKKLPIVHCLAGTTGCEIREELDLLRKTAPIDKHTFGSTRLARKLVFLNWMHKLGKVTLVGLCTDICVIANAALIKSYLPEVQVRVDASCCAGVTPESHQNALRAMEAMHITIENEA